MAIQNWSDDITVVDLADDPQFTEDMAALADALAAKPTHVVLNFSTVSFLNSSNISRLLRLRKQMISADRRLILVGVNDSVAGVFQVTGLEKIFEFSPDMATALALVQLSEPQG
jgi:anti-anti-sigma factor